MKVGDFGLARQESEYDAENVSRSNFPVKVRKSCIIFPLIIMANRFN